MPKYKILYQHIGEFTTMPKIPIDLWFNQVDLAEIIPGTAIVKYDVRLVELPDWIKPEIWVDNNSLRARLKWFTDICRQENYKPEVEMSKNIIGMTAPEMKQNVRLLKKRANTPVKRLKKFLGECCGSYQLQ